MNNRQAAVVAASAAGLTGSDFELRVQVLELWLNELDRASAANAAPMSLAVIETAMGNASDLLRGGHGTVVRVAQNEGNPVVELSDRTTYLWANERWYSRGPIQVTD